MEQQKNTGSLWNACLELVGDVGLRRAMFTKVIQMVTEERKKVRPKGVTPSQKREERTKERVENLQTMCK